MTYYVHIHLYIYSCNEWYNKIYIKQWYCKELITIVSSFVYNDVWLTKYNVIFKWISIETN